MKHTKAFTLIELLVVIAIIAILAAILFPVFAQAKIAAKKTVALSNAKQIATANMIYMGDYDDALIKEFFGFPEYPACNWGAGPYYSWRNAMMPYLKSDGILADSTNPFAAATFNVDTAPNGNKISTNFAVNNDVIGFANGRCAGPWTPEGLSSLSQVDEPAGTILLIPNRTQWNDLKPSFISTMEAKNAGDPANSWCIPLNGKTNCPADPYGPIHAIGGSYVAWVWADGHAKPKSPLATLDTSNANRDDWASSLALNPRTGKYWTQADRLAVAKSAWPEYK